MSERVPGVTRESSIVELGLTTHALRQAVKGVLRFVRDVPDSPPAHGNADGVYVVCARGHLVVADLLKLKSEEMLFLRGCGPSSLREIDTRLHEVGLVREEVSIQIADHRRVAMADRYLALGEHVATCFECQSLNRCAERETLITACQTEVEEMCLVPVRKRARI